VNAPLDWWRDFFGGLVVDFWRAAMPPEATRAEADFFQKQLAPPPGGRLLDVPCGDGRLALELARRGYRVTGVDISEDFLAAARRGAADEGLAVDWRLSEMRDLPWQSEFDGAFCAGSSFGFLGDEGDFAFLAAVCRTLKPGARLAIDGLKAAEVILPQFRERHEMVLGDLRFEAENRYDHATGCTENRYTVTRGRTREVKTARHRIYTYREIGSMLEWAGFVACAGYGSLSGESFQLGSPRLLMVAEKAPERPGEGSGQ
jgi:SAM-dependent methyltransferase